MKGLLIKDFLQLKREFRLLYLILMFFPAISGLANPQFFLPTITVLMSIYSGTFVLASLGKDETTNWVQISQSFPILLRELILEKYIFALILSVIANLVVFLIGCIASFILQLSFYLVILYAMCAGLFCFLFCLFVIPISYKFGSNNCRYFIFAFAAMPGIIAILANNFQFDFLSFINSVTLSKLQLILLFIGIFAFCILLSLILSFRWYRKYY
jgi:ABC-2 type transport system permease protein